MTEKFDLEAIRRSAEPGAMFGAIIVRDLVDRLERAEADVVNWKATAISRGERLEQAEQQVARVRAMAQDWDANGNSCAVGDRSADVWHATANAILRALDGDGLG